MENSKLTENLHSFLFLLCILLAYIFFVQIAKFVVPFPSLSAFDVRPTKINFSIFVLGKFN
jgi:hypothetical protein